MGRLVRKAGAEVMLDFDERVKALERWKAAQAREPTIFDVIATRDVELIGTFIELAFRQAAAMAVEETKRADRVRALARETYGDPDTAEAFLRRPHSQLSGATPLAAAVKSDEGAAAVVRLAMRWPPGRLPG